MTADARGVPGSPGAVSGDGGPARRIAELIDGGPTLSLEFFPPRTPAALDNLRATLDEVEPLGLDFVSVTYGAGGSTRDTTRDLVVEICRDRPYPAMAHLTCVGHTREELVGMLEDYRANGVCNILALAGDPPADGSPAEGDFTYAAELVELIREVGGFSIGVAAHPELHPRSVDRAQDRRHLADKLAAADFGVTQFFFDADDYFRMCDELAELGCHTPVLPGVMPVVNPGPIARFADMAKARRPAGLWARLEAAGSPEEVVDIAVEAANELVARLREGGAPGIHLYSLNRSDAVLRVCADQGLLGRTPATTGAASLAPGVNERDD